MFAVHDRIDFSYSIEIWDGRKSLLGNGKFVSQLLRNRILVKYLKLINFCNNEMKMGNKVAEIIFEFAKVDVG